MTDLLPIGTRVRITKDGSARLIGKLATITGYSGSERWPYILEPEDKDLSNGGWWSREALDVFQSVEERIETLTYSRDRLGELYGQTKHDLQVARRDLRAATTSLENVRLERDELLARLDYVETLLTEVQAARLQGYTDAREEL